MKARRFHFVEVAAVLALTCCGQSRAVDPYAKGSPVIIKTVEPDVVQGAMLELSLGGGALVRTADQQLRRIPTEDLVRISSLSTPHERGRRQLMLTLRGGDVLYGRLAAPADSVEVGDAVAVESYELGRLTIPLDSLARFDTARAFLPQYRELISKFELESRNEEDRILLTNSDEIRGFVTLIDVDGVVLESALGETRIAHDLILVLLCGDSEPAELSRPHFIVTLQSGGRLATSELNWTASMVEAVLRFGQRVHIEPERIHRIDVVGGRWEWLGEHRPISYEHTPMLALDWPFVVDRNVRGTPMTIDGETLEHGVGVHSRSILTYDLKGAYREFVTSLGMDDESGPHADVTALILVDGKRRWHREHIRRGTLLGPVRVDVHKAKRVELVVDFGDNGDLQDRFNWVDAALIR